MLTKIRAKTGSWIVKILFVLLIAAFGIWGIGDIFRGDRARSPVAQIGNSVDLPFLPDIPIDHVVKYSQREFQGDLKKSLDQFTRSQNLPISAAQFAELGGAAQVIAQAVNRGLLQVYADRLNLGMSLEAAITNIQQDPTFQNELGQFDRRRFESVLAQNNLSESGYVAEMRANMINREIYAAAFGGVNGPETLARASYLYQMEQRTAEVLTIPAASMKDIAAPDDAALVAYHKDHADRYQSPEYRAATVLLLSPADFTGDVTVTDQEIADEYEARKAEFGTPDQREVEQVVVQDQAMADKIEAAIKGGKAFAEAVKELTGGEPVSLGKVTKDKLPAEIADKVFALSVSAVSEPLNSAFGIHIVHVLAVENGTTKSLADVKDELKNSLALVKAAESMDSITKQLEDTLASGATLQEAADKSKLKAEKLVAVDAAGKDANGQDLKLPPDLVKLVFGTDAGNLSAVTPLSDGSYAVAEVSGSTPPALKPLDQVRDQVKADWTAEQQQNAAEAKAKDIATRLKAGGDLAAEAKMLGLEMKVTAPFTREVGSPADGIDPAFAADLFKAKLAELTIGHNAEGPVVARVSGITPADPDAHADDVKQLRQALAQQIRTDLAAQFSQALQQEITVTVHEDVVQSLIKE